jgi:hypothetical protein
MYVYSSTLSSQKITLFKLVQVENVYLSVLLSSLLVELYIGGVLLSVVCDLFKLSYFICSVKTFFFVSKEKRQNNKVEEMKEIKKEQPQKKHHVEKTFVSPETDKIIAKSGELEKLLLRTAN